MSRGGPSASRDGEPQMRTFAGLDKEGWEKVNEVMKPAVLELALRCEWRGVITKYLPGDLCSQQVDPLILAVTTLESILTDPQTSHYGRAIELLEYIHSRVPQTGEATQYTKLLVDMKTKAVISELFTGKCLFDLEARKSIINKFFPHSLYNDLKDEYSPSDQPVCSTPTEYSMYLHKYASIGLTRLALVEKERLDFQCNNLLRPSVALELHQSLVQHALAYLSKVKMLYALPHKDDLRPAQPSSRQPAVDLMEYTPRASPSLKDFSILVNKLPVCPLPSPSTQMKEEEEEEGEMEEAGKAGQERGVGEEMEEEMEEESEGKEEELEEQEDEKPKKRKKRPRMARKVESLPKRQHSVTRIKWGRDSKGRIVKTVFHTRGNEASNKTTKLPSQSHHSTRRSMSKYHCRGYLPHQSDGKAFGGRSTSASPVSGSSSAMDSIETSSQENHFRVRRSLKREAKEAATYQGRPKRMKTEEICRRVLPARKNVHRSCKAANHMASDSRKAASMRSAAIPLTRLSAASSDETVSRVKESTKKQMRHDLSSDTDSQEFESPGRSNGPIISPARSKGDAQSSELRRSRRKGVSRKRIRAFLEDSETDTNSTISLKSTSRVEKRPQSDFLDTIDSESSTRRRSLVGDDILPLTSESLRERFSGVEAKRPPFYARMVEKVSSQGETGENSQTSEAPSVEIPLQNEPQVRLATRALPRGVTYGGRGRGRGNKKWRGMPRRGRSRGSTEAVSLMEGARGSSQLSQMLRDYNATELLTYLGMPQTTAVRGIASNFDESVTVAESVTLSSSPQQRPCSSEYAVVSLVRDDVEYSQSQTQNSYNAVQQVAYKGHRAAYKSHRAAASTSGSEDETCV